VAEGKRPCVAPCPRSEALSLPRTVRKLIGAVLLLVFVTVYALVAMTIGAARLPGTSTWVQTAYYAVAGLIWVIPAGLIIKWMQRPGPGED
jgi:hypothetical protein